MSAPATLTAEQLALVRRFVDLPTAPFAEREPIQFIRRFVAERKSLALREDRFGNLFVHYRKAGRRLAGKASRPVVLAAHLDHPGFIADRMDADGTLRAFWRGWVRRPFFEGSAVRFWNGRAWVGGKIVELIEPPPAPNSRAASPHRRGAKASAAGAKATAAGPKSAATSAKTAMRSAQAAATGAASRTFAGRAATMPAADAPPFAVRVRVRGDVPSGAPGMWDLPDSRVVGGRLRSRMCDDVAGAAAMMLALDGLHRTRAAGELICFFSRAEEVGFGGALAAAADGGLPKKSLVISVECSKAIAGVTIGGGPVLRVGDKATVFTPAATAFCQVIADELVKSKPGFAYQRKLMDGGTCEATAYWQHGYDTTGLCLPLANYHNMDEQAGEIGSEEVAVTDLARLVQWFVALATSTQVFSGGHPTLGERLAKLLAEHRPVLLETAAAMR